MLLPMKPESCPFYASDDLDVIAVEQDRAMLAVSCKECGATGPLSLSEIRRMPSIGGISAWAG